MITNHEKADILIEALPFIKKYSGKTVVIKYGGSAMADEEIKNEFIKNVSVANIAAAIIYGLTKRLKLTPLESMAMISLSEAIFDVK